MESVSFLPESAVTGGIDYDWRIGKRWGLNGYWSGSNVSGSAEAISLLQQSNVHSFQRPDAEHVELDPLATSLRGHSGNINFAKIAGERTRLNVNIGYLSPGFDVNDLGFQRRADQIPQNSWFQFRWNTPGKYKRNGSINFNQWSSYNFDGDRLGFGGNINSHWTFQNQLNTGGGVNVNAENFDDRLTRGGPGGYGRANVNGWHYFNTDDRRLVSVFSNFNFYYDGRSHNFSVSPGVSLRPTAAFSAEFGVSYESRLDDAQWVNAVTAVDGTTHYVFGRLDQKTSSITARVNYTITPNLSVQVYAQPFVSTGLYGNFKELVNGRADDYDDRYAPFAYDGLAGLQGPVLPHHERDALGVQARLHAVRRLAAGARRPRPAECLPLRPGLRRHFLDALVQRIPREARLLAQSVTHLYFWNQVSGIRIQGWARPWA